METGTFITLGLYFVLMLAIGLYAYRESTSDVSGYILGGRRLGPAVASLSAGASDMSGWMLLGLPGAMYLSGLSSMWIAIGLFIGAFANYLIVAPRLRLYTELARDALTIPDYFDKRFLDRTRLLRVISSLVIIVFFTLYTSSGLVAGGKLFESAFGLDYSWGLFITAGVVMAYTLLGGFWGLGYFGQPHIIVRFMAVRSVRDVATMRNIGMSWMLVTLVGALGTGLAGLAYASRTGLVVEDPETIFILLSDVLFNPLITGFLLAAILAAIMSTISSQLLVSSSSLTEDFYGIFLRKNASQKELVLVGRLTVLAVAVAAGILAWNPSNSVLGLVSQAWAGFGAAFGPLVILSLTWKRMTRNGALAGMIVGAATVLVWTYAPVLADGAVLGTLVYEIVPGFILSFLAIVVVSLMGKAPTGEVAETFDRVVAGLAEARGPRKPA